MMIGNGSENRFGNNDIYGNAIIEVKRMRFSKVKEIGERLLIEAQSNNMDIKGYSDIFEQIEDARHNIVLNNQKILALKGSIVCDSCKNMLPIGSQFCNRCGAGQRELDSEVMSVLRYKMCPQCGEVYGLENKFCGRCGIGI